MEEKKARKKLFNRYSIFSVIAIALYIGIAFIAMPYINGTDQYWNQIDVQSILNSRFHSNEYYPAYILNSDSNGMLPEFIHNNMAIYLWALAARFFDDIQIGVKVINIVFSCLSALMISSVAKKKIGRSVTLETLILMLFFPVLFWQSIQMLSEVLAVFFVCLSIWLASNSRKNYFFLFGTFVSSIIACNIRSNFLLFAVFIWIIMLKERFSLLKFTRQKIMLVVASGLCIVLSLGIIRIFLIREGVLSGYLFSGFYDLVNKCSVNTTPTNMALYFRNSTVDYSIGELISNYASKIWNAIRIQFHVSKESIIFIVNNLLFGIVAVCSLVIGMKKGIKKELKLMLICFITLISWLVMSAYLQNQFRYSAIYTPFLLLAFVYIKDRIQRSSESIKYRSKSICILGYSFLIGIIGVSLILSIISHKAAIGEHNVREKEIAEINQSLDEESNIIFLTSDFSPYQSTLFYPRKIAVIDTSYQYSQTESQILLEGEYFNDLRNIYVVSENVLSSDMEVLVEEQGYTLTQEFGQYYVFERVN